MKTHYHTCAHCQGKFSCDCKKTASGYETDIAAKANAQGPFCELCRHIEMACRYAHGRSEKTGYSGYVQAYSLLKNAQSLIHTVERGNTIR